MTLSVSSPDPFIRPLYPTRLNSIARTAAKRLSLAWRLVPHVTQHDLADISRSSCWPNRERHPSRLPDLSSL
ncbi:MAG TPA: hypothetical protein VEL76_31400, partial [Gemmataceae bacterium]|nr:hypothetical protein [Gemmataceae bacterium]